MSDIELLPCPFCGGSVRMEEVRLKSGIWHGIICRNTSNRGGSCAYECHPSRTPEAAAARWNMRSGYTAVDMATAAADGFRDGAASKPEPCDGCFMAEAEALRKDAARYRWLREQGGKVWDDVMPGIPATGAIYDIAVDAVMSKES